MRTFAVLDTQELNCTDVQATVLSLLSMLTEPPASAILFVPVTVKGGTWGSLACWWPSSP